MSPATKAASGNGRLDIGIYCSGDADFCPSVKDAQAVDLIHDSSPTIKVERTPPFRRKCILCAKGHSTNRLESLVQPGRRHQVAGFAGVKFAKGDWWSVHGLDRTTITGGHSKVLIRPSLAVMLHLDEGLVPPVLGKVNAGLSRI